MCPPFDLDYLGLAPVTSNGVGVGLITLRFREDDLEPLPILLQRAALERLRDDIDSLLATNSVLSSEETINRARLQRVTVAPDILEQFGVFDYQYAGEIENFSDPTEMEDDATIPVDIRELLWMYAAQDDFQWSVNELKSAVKNFGDHETAALIWALQQDDQDLKMLILQLLQEDCTDADDVLPYLRSLISEREDRLVCLTAINTVGILGDTSEGLIPILMPRLNSDDAYERLISAGNLWRISRSEDAYVILRQMAAGDEGNAMTMMAREYLKE